MIELFVPLGVSLRQYAARRFYNPGTVSRFLSGQRTIPLKFLMELLEDAAAEHNAPVTDEVRTHTIRLHLEALRVSNTHAYEVQSLTNQLHEATKKVQRADLTITALQEALETRQRRVNDLEVENLSLTASSVLSDGASASLENERNQLARENTRLRLEIEQLRTQLILALEARERAVIRAAELEQELEALETAEELALGDAVDAAELVDPLEMLAKIQATLDQHF